LLALPSHLDNGHGCSSYARYNGWTCLVTLSLNQGAQRSLKWRASGGIDGTTFSPSEGTLSPDKKEAVTISIPVIGGICPTDTSFVFSEVSGATRATVLWHCS
jgi:hypothetical protein